jgi:tRNA pseudouridine55 synthase
LLVDKAPGLTSHDVVARVRRALDTRAVGHTGTLDPFATGLLVVLVGRATRLAQFVEGQSKTYHATLRLGMQTDTDDVSGAPIGGAEPAIWPSEGQVRDALLALRGTHWQRPPAYSAKHVNGVRSYRLARRGEAVELPPVEVTVSAVELLAWRAPDAEFRVTVSAGTYIRALARDVGTALGVGGHLVALRRERIGTLHVRDAVPIERVSVTGLRAPLAVLGHLPQLLLDEGQVADVRHGRPIAGPVELFGTVALVDGDTLVAVADADAGRLRPVMVLGGVDG